MRSQKSYLCFLWILCLPLLSEAKEASIHSSHEDTEFLSLSLVRARRHGHFPDCRPKPVCPCKPGPWGPSSLGTLAYGDFHLSLPMLDRARFGPGTIIPIISPRADLGRHGLSVDTVTNEIIVEVPGVYEISYVVTITPTTFEPASYTLALQLDGVILPGSMRSVLASRRRVDPERVTTQIQIQGQVLQTIQSGQAVSVVNASADSGSVIVLEGPPSSFELVEQASLILRKIDNLP